MKARFFIAFFYSTSHQNNQHPTKRTETHLERTKAPKPTNLSSHTINTPRTAQNEPKQHTSNKNKTATNKKHPQRRGVFIFTVKP